MGMAETNVTKLNLSTYEKLEDALFRDDEEAFISIVNDQGDAFRPRQQDLLHEVCRYPSVKCAEALIKGNFEVDLNKETSLGMFPLHSAAESCWPSITDLFLYYGARTDVRSAPACNNLSFFTHKYKVEECTNKLPLHMPLLRISYLPFMREWIPYKHSLFTLFFLLCLPRMQNPLVTLELLVGKTNEADDEFYKLAMDAKILEVTALLMAAHKMFSSDTMSIVQNQLSHKYGPPFCHPPADALDRSSSMSLVMWAFGEKGDELEAYLEQDKYNVSKHQVIEIIKHLFGEDVEMLDPSEMDLTKYKWYRDEDRLYPLKAPFESIRRVDDIGMEHYSAKHLELWRLSKKEPGSSVPHEHLTSTFSGARSLFRPPCFFDNYVRGNKMIPYRWQNYLSKAMAFLTSTKFVKRI